MSKWYPIKRAPRDGTMVILGWISENRLEYTVESYWCQKTNRWHGGWQPTHWRPHKMRRPKRISHGSTRSE